MNLPSLQALEDASLRLEYAAAAVAPLLELLELRAETPPTNPADRPAYEQSAALLSALRAYFPAVSCLLELHDQQVSEMRAEMGAAQQRYTQMGIERDYCLAELRQANGRYYNALDTLTSLQSRFHAAA